MSVGTSDVRADLALQEARGCRACPQTVGNQVSVAPWRPSPRRRWQGFRGGSSTPQPHVLVVGTELSLIQRRSCPGCRPVDPQRAWEYMTSGDAVTLAKVPLAEPNSRHDPQRDTSAKGGPPLRRSRRAHTNDSSSASVAITPTSDPFPSRIGIVAVMPMSPDEWKRYAELYAGYGAWATCIFHQGRCFMGYACTLCSSFPSHGVVEWE